jgi:hypothetical protein
MRRGANRRMMVDTSKGRYALSPIDLRENWPAFLKQMRLSGNQVFDPMTYFANTFTSPQDAQVEDSAWTYIISRCKLLERQSRFGSVPPSIGFDDENDLWQTCNQAQVLCRSGDPFYFFQGIQLVDEWLQVFDRVCIRLAATNSGFGKGIYMEVIEMARIFVPFIADPAIDPHPLYQGLSSFGLLYRLLESLYKMAVTIGLEDETLRRVLLAIPLAWQGQLCNAVTALYQTSHQYLANLILFILQ